MSYQRIFDAFVDGIPCCVGVTHYLRVQGSGNWNAPSDLDYHGYTELEFDVLDRRGRPAPWLERKLTSRSREVLEQHVLIQLEN